MTVTGMLTWLGGGQRVELADHERSDYAVTGAVVVLFGLVAGTITALALDSTGSWPLLGLLFAALVVAAAAVALGRALATRKPGRMPDRLGLIARIVIAVLIGGLIAELAAIVLFSGSVDRIVDEQARRSAATAPAVLAARAELDRAKDSRTALDQSIAKAEADVERALIIARCELSPAPGCPQFLVTHVPGRGPEAQVANEMLDDARNQLRATQDRVVEAERRLADRESAVTAAESRAAADADRGLGARWQAMNDYTTGHADALPLRILTILALILLALLPLILRWWRGETSLDRQVAAHLVQDRAEREADAAIAVKRAEVRAGAEELRAEQQLSAARLAVEADAAIDRERQRTRIVAAIGGLEIGIAEPRQGEDRRAALPAAETPEGSMTPNLPATTPALTPATQATPPKSPGGLELPIIGTVPFTDTAARWIRPLVPAFVANAIDTATHPLRTARQAFEEVEEITFTLRRTRKVTVDTQDSHHPGGYQLTPGSPEARQAHQIAATVVDADYPHPTHTALHPATTHTGLPTATAQDELPTRHTPQLPGRPHPRELPPAN